ncbi:hypothetical protein [Hymenobacter metallilatus]|uniref:Uncharacterized protein n=1 Tax=Hymenobacter metallilatus TaxID=2493666 RepID=A0A3R9NDS6_9BACT|nr:hypothetical protein [Hymenobacter metallilatus]RSK31728.1 hypothetical protein EI290_12930 [Hymenobacter metallilatus]
MQNGTLPKWLTETLINGISIWNKAASTSFPHLLQQITLHDSIWSYAFIPEVDRLVLIIQLDSHWNKDFCHQLDDWPYLAIEITEPLNTSYIVAADPVTNIISKAASESVAYSNFTEWISAGKSLGIIPTNYPQLPQYSVIHRTEIETIGGYFSCIHQEAIRILLYSSGGESLAINFSHRKSSPYNPAVLKQKEPGILSRLFHWKK